ncbi:MAG: hypothetical protein E7055_11080 [Lentisphaerae bacterium]|nr:hypothetical protein [Lentisphaerota bacterium]
MKANRPKDPCIPLKLRDIKSIKIAIPDEQEFGHLLWMIFTAAETGEYDEAAAAELSIAARDWYDRMYADCCRNVFQYNARNQKRLAMATLSDQNPENKGACFDENPENKGACFDPSERAPVRNSARGKNIHIHSHIHSEGKERKRTGAEGNDSSHFPYPEPPTAAATIYREAVNSGYLISARETKAFYMRYAANGWKDPQGNSIRDYRRILDFWRKNQSEENRKDGEALYEEFSQNGGFTVPEAIRNLDRIFNQTDPVSGSPPDGNGDPDQWITLPDGTKARRSVL